MEDLSDRNESNATPRLTGPLADALERDRDAFNARFAYARTLSRQLDAGAFSTHLVENVGPIIDAVAAVRPERVDVVTQVLFELSLDWVGRKWLGPESRDSHLNELWREHLPKLAPFLCEDPRGVARSLTYAVHALGNRDAGRARIWMRRLVEIADICRDECAHIKTLLDIGKVLAWRCGMAHYRESALEVWRGLGDEVRYHVLILSPQDEPALLDKKTRPTLEALDAAFENPWFHPVEHMPAEFARRGEDEISLRTVGGFVGFGHEFEAPPTVMLIDGSLFALDGQTWFEIYADSFGATLQNVGSQSRASIQPSDPTRAREERVMQAIVVREPNLVEATSIASTSSTLALTLPHSHRIFLVG